jgi:N-acetylmuramoyl-L-alanine amidase
MLVLHYTGMPEGRAALERLCNAEARVSAHYLIEEDGTVYALVDETRRAWHAGLGSWRGHDDINSRSIGIEIVNPGHEFGYRAFPLAQMEALAPLALGILTRHPIPARNVVGHADVAPARKEDPGELFDWAWLAARGVGLWPAANAPAAASASEEQIAGMLTKFGYGISEAPTAPNHSIVTPAKAGVHGSLDSLARSAGEETIARKARGRGNDKEKRTESFEYRAALIAFQRHFRPARFDGMADAETIGILAALLAMTNDTK